MHLILKCIQSYEIPYSDNYQYLTCQENDIVVCDSFVNLKGEIFGFGKDYKLNIYGLFLVKYFVLVDHTNYVDKELGWVISKNLAKFSDKDQKFTPGISHRVSKKSVGALSTCLICGEFAMGLRQEYFHCTICNQIFHRICFEHHRTSKNCHRFLKTTNQECVAALSPTDVSLSDWSKEQVLQWLCSVGLFRLIDLFELKNITGQYLMDNQPRDESEIINLQNNNTFWSFINDTFYRQSLYEAIVTLIEPSSESSNDQCARDNSSPSDMILSSMEKAEDHISERYCIKLRGHKFRETSYTCKISCFYCNKILLGLQKQGFHCVKCENNYHKTCALQVNIPLCSETEDSKNLNEYNSSIFGVTLQEQKLNEIGVPLFLACCIEELNIRLNSNFDVNRSLECYSQTVSTDDTVYLKKLFSHPTYDSESRLIGLTDISDVQIAKLIKLFFKELPEPLLTYGFYHSLVESVKEKDDKICSTQIHSIILDLPTCNKDTLKFLIKHFDMICSKFNDSVSKVKTISRKWSCIFSKTLIWPPQIMVNLFPVLKSKHQRIIQLLFEQKLLLFDRFSTSMFNVSICEAPYIEDELSISQSLGRDKLQSLKYSFDKMSSDIKSQDWYWSDTTKEEVNEYMAGLRDGYFMVRDSSDKALGAYTLTIRKDGENKLIRIIQRNGKYGFQEPCQFDNVPQLIKYYQTNKLIEYNDQLNITLLYPCSKNKSDIQGQISDYDGIDNENLIEKLSKTMKEYAELNAKVDKNTEQFEFVQKELDDVTKCLKGIDRIQKWCSNHTVHIMNNMQTNQKMRDHFQKCLAQLNKKLNDCDQVIRNMNERREKLSSQSDLLQTSLSEDRPNLKRLNRNQSQLIRIMKDRGVPDEYFSADVVDIDKLCNDIRSALNDKNPINIKSNWFIENVSRETASNMLAGKPDGTFLIRKSSEQDKYALDVIVKGVIQHCRIFCYGGKYGFIENDCFYENLEQLVKTFHTHSLSRYNHTLDTVLRYPVKGSSTE